MTANPVSAWGLLERRASVSDGSGGRPVERASSKPRLWHFAAGAFVEHDIRLSVPGKAVKAALFSDSHPSEARMWRYDIGQASSGSDGVPPASSPSRALRADRWRTGIPRGRSRPVRRAA